MEKIKEFVEDAFDYQKKSNIKKTNLEREHDLNLADQAKDAVVLQYICLP